LIETNMLPPDQTDYSLTSLVPSLGLRIVPAHEAGLGSDIRREHMPPHKRKGEDKVCCV